MSRSTIHSFLCGLTIIVSIFFYAGQGGKQDPSQFHQGQLQPVLEGTVVQPSGSSLNEEGLMGYSLIAPVQVLIRTVDCFNTLTPFTKPFHTAVPGFGRYFRQFVPINISPPLYIAIRVLLI